MAEDRERSVNVAVISDPSLPVGSKTCLLSKWGLGNQVSVHHVYDGGKPTETVDVHDENRIPLNGPPGVYTAKWDVEMHSPCTRKLVNESHNIFMSLQSHKPETSETVRKPQLVKFSRNHRSVLRACLLELQQKGAAEEDEETQEEYNAQCQTFTMIELIWSLCEILFVETLPGGVVLTQLLDWAIWHFRQADDLAQEVMSAPDPEHHESYWPAIYTFVLKGRIDEARQMLSLHPDQQHDIHGVYAKMDELLRKMPMFSVIGRQSVPEFDMKWRHWQDQCQQFLEEVGSHKNLETICRILAGDNSVFLELRDLTETWYMMLVAKLLYSNPTVKTIDLHYHTQECIDAYGGNSHLTTLDNILLAALEFDVHQVIRESSSNLNNWWFVAHLTDLLHHCGRLESHNVNFGSKLREFLLLEYAASLMTHDSLWQIGADYLDHCPDMGRHYLELYIERIPLQSKKKKVPTATLR